MNLIMRHKKAAGKPTPLALLIPRPKDVGALRDPCGLREWQVSVPRDRRVFRVTDDILAF